MGGEPQCWAEGRCLIFDDSFLHTAYHGGKSEPPPPELKAALCSRDSGYLQERCPR